MRIEPFLRVLDIKADILRVLLELFYPLAGVLQRASYAAKTLRDVELPPPYSSVDDTLFPAL